MSGEKKINREIVESILNCDGLANAEKITGESYKDDKFTESLGFLFHIRNVKMREELMKEMGDTCFSETTENYLKKVLSIGFKVVLELPFDSIDKWDGNKVYKETFYVLWHYDYSILLVFDTYRGHRNGGNFYFNWSPNSINGRGDALSQCSGGYAGHGIGYKINNYRPLDHVWNRWKKTDGITTPEFTPHKIPYELMVERPNFNDMKWEDYREASNKWESKLQKYIEDNDLGFVYDGNKDCREGIIYSIGKLVDDGIFLKKWVAKSHIWLCHHGDTDGEFNSEKYDRIFEERFAMLPKEVQDAITPEIFTDNNQ